MIKKLKTLLRPCPICNSKQGEMLHTQKFVMPQDHHLPAEYDVVACSECGFTYADTGAKQQDYDNYYTLLSKYEDKKTASGGGGNEVDLNRIAETAEEIARSCPNKQAKIIDIGCANGGLLKKLKEKGYTNLMGFAPSKKCAETVLSNNIPCAQGSLFEINKVLNGQKFDYVILSHVMEHVYDLQKTFNNYGELLNDKGKLYIEVPNAAFYDNFFVAPFSYFDGEHINNFDKDSVCLSTQAKLSIKRYVDFSKKQVQIENDTISELVRTQEEIFVFGVGSFTHRLLASTDLSKCKIKAFIDNDSNKQERLLEGKSILPPPFWQILQNKLSFVRPYSLKK